MNQIYHHGIKGQKWGVRRFQNEDGTYTAAGKRRYSSDEESDDALKSQDWNNLYSQIQDKKKNSSSLKKKLQKIDSEKEAAYEKQANDYSSIDVVKKIFQSTKRIFSSSTRTRANSKNQKPVQTCSASICKRCSLWKSSLCL